MKSGERSPPRPGPGFRSAASGLRSLKSEQHTRNDPAGLQPLPGGRDVAPERYETQFATHRSARPIADYRVARPDSPLKTTWLPEAKHDGIIRSSITFTPSLAQLFSRPMRFPSFRACYAALLPTNFKYRKASANLARQLVGNLSMARDRLDGTSVGVSPKGVGPTFPLKITTMLPEMQKQRASFHDSTTVSRSASTGTPRKESSRRSSRISAIDSAKLSRASCLVRP
jgi:hypothetical protein